LASASPTSRSRIRENDLQKVVDTIRATEHPDAVVLL
jgi:hypothetical protein